jgi:hypothetical protein
MPFAAALIAASSGEVPWVVLRGEATALMRPAAAAQVHAAEWPALPDLLRRVEAQGIPIFV